MDTKTAKAQVDTNHEGFLKHSITASNQKSFFNFDFGIKTSATQYVCRNCGRSISSDTAIFNRSVCGKCTATRNANQKSLISPPINEQQLGSRKFRLQGCKYCFKSFWRLGMGANICRECSGSFPIPETVGAYIKPLGGVYVL